MNKKNAATGLLRPYRAEIWFLLVISTFVNVLVLTSPFFMLLLYDKAVPSSSVETLLVLSLLAFVLFAFYGAFDYLRGRVASRIGIEIQWNLDEAFFLRSDKKDMDSMRDLERIQQFFSSPVAVAMIDVVWSPLFIIVSFIFDFWLGMFSLICVLLLTAIAIINYRLNRDKIKEVQKQSAIGDYLSREYVQEKEIIHALGMQSPIVKRWFNARKIGMKTKLESADKAGLFGTLSKSLRLMAQSGILALGAFLVIIGDIPAGMMISGSILLGRTLAPIDQVIGQWGLIEEFTGAWKRTKEKYAELPEPQEKTELPNPNGRVAFQGVTATYRDPKSPALVNVNFRLEPGQAMGVIGMSASGKTTLAKVLTGVVPVLGGRVELDGASIDQYEPERLGALIGYLPQNVSMLSGTIAENISRFDERDSRDEKIIKAAKLAGAHDLITSLPDGYDTKLPGALSGGQMQRIALARALYDDPPVLVFDEPNSSLDNDGTIALNQSIRDAKSNNRSVIIIAHRPAAIEECDLLLMLDHGRVVDFGPRDDVLRKQVQNYRVVKRASNAE